MDQQAADAEVTELADEVSIEEDVTGLEIPVDDRVGLVGMEEDERGANLPDDPDADLPCEGWSVIQAN